MEVSKVERLLSRWDMGTPLVQPSACAPVRHQNSSCRLCLDVCPVGAIAINGLLAVDPDVCVGCGICTAVCPNEALAQRRSDVQLVAEAAAVAADAAGDVTFACARQPGSAGAVAVPCIGSLKDEVLLATIASGAGRIRLAGSACDGCAIAQGRELAERAAQRVNSLLGALGRDERVEITTARGSGAAPDSAAVRPARNRRQFLGLAGHEMAAAVAVMALPEEPEEGPRQWLEEHYIPVRARLLAFALQRLLAGHSIRLTDDVGSPAHDVAITDDCTGCGMCVTFCPTGALQSQAATDGELRISFRWDRCSGCNLCQETCYRQAIRVEPKRVLKGDTARAEELWRGRPQQPSDSLVREWARGLLRPE